MSIFFMQIEKIWDKKSVKGVMTWEGCLIVKSTATSNATPVTGVSASYFL